MANTAVDDFVVESTSAEIPPPSSTPSPDAPPPTSPPAAPLDAPPAAPSPAAEAPPATPETDAEEASEAGRKLGGRRKSLQQRLDEVTWEREEQRRRAEEYQARLQQVEADRHAAKPADDTQDPEPSLDDFTSPTAYEDWIKAHTKWTARQVAREEYRAARERDERAAADRALEARQAVIERQGTERHADFVTVLSAFAQQGGRFNPYVTDVILHHELGHEVAYALATDPEAYRRIHLAPTFAHASIELGKLLARLEAAPTGSAPAAVPLTRAHPPITPVGSAPVASSDPDPDTLSFEDFVKRENAKERERRRR